MRPRAITLRVGHWITVALPLIALTAVRPALAADDDKAPDAASKEGAGDAKDSKDSGSAKDEKSEASASGSAEASATVSTDAAASSSVGGEANGGAAGSEEKTAAASPASIPAPPGDVARLPGEAYPNEPIRGIEGGSLWMTFHGLQWPVSPFHTDTPRTQLGFSGSGWVDTGYKKVNSGAPNSVDVARWITQGRFVLRATPTYTKGDWFVQGQAELVANKDQTIKQPDVADTDDLWLRAGRWNQWDVQVGRYEAWELYHLGMGLDLNTVEREGANDGQTQAPPAIYGVTHAYYRPSGVGNVAVHVYPMKFLRFELLGQLGNQSSLNTFAARPSGVLDFGIVKVKGGFEYMKVTAQADDNQTDQQLKGGGGAVQVVLDPHVEFGVNGAYSIVDKIDGQGRVDSEGSVTVYSVGGFANARVVGPLLVGVGANYTRVDDLHIEPPPSNLHGEFSHFQGFGAVQVVVLDQLFIKAVAAYAKADFAPTFTMSEPYQNTAISARLRLMYLF
jgi:hypothetical protein